MVSDAWLLSVSAEAKSNFPVRALGAARRSDALAVWATVGIFGLHWNELLRFPVDLGTCCGQLPATARLSMALAMAQVAAILPRRHLCHRVVDRPVLLGQLVAWEPLPELEPRRHRCLRVQHGMLRDVTACYLIHRVYFFPSREVVRKAGGQSR